MTDTLKKDIMKTKDQIDDIEKRMKELLKKEKDNLLSEVEDAVHKKKSMMQNPDDEE